MSKLKLRRFKRHLSLSQDRKRRSYGRRRLRLVRKPVKK